MSDTEVVKSDAERWVEYHYPEVAVKAGPGVYQLMEEYAAHVTAGKDEEIEDLLGELNCR